MINFTKGQTVQYRFVWGGGHDTLLRDWFSGYVVVEPVSPYAKGCALIQRNGNGPLDIPFNAPFSDLRAA